MTFDSNIALDHPVNSMGDNPDVMLDFRGQRWALALKTMRSRKPITSPLNGGMNGGSNKY
jgi:hypothetical protein